MKPTQFDIVRVYITENKRLVRERDQAQRAKRRWELVALIALAACITLLTQVNLDLVMGALFIACLVLVALAGWSFQLHRGDIDIGVADPADHSWRSETTTITTHPPK